MQGEQVTSGLNLSREQPGHLRPCRRAHRPGPGDTATIGLLHERNLRRSEIPGEQLQAARKDT
jgi:hypothetical protein